MAFDLNVDLGELEGAAARERDLALLTHATRINVACGFHAGDEETMRTLSRAAAERGVLLGAHVGYRDREEFGRRELGVSPSQIAAETVEQLRTLAEIAAGAGAGISHVKPHGALYHRLGADPEAARLVAAAIAAEDEQLAILTLPGSALATAAAAAGLPVLREGFADRAYTAAGGLVARGTPGAMLGPERAAAQALAIATSRAFPAADGTPLRVDVETLCVHGDEEHAIATAAAVRRAIDGPAAPVDVRAAGEQALLVTVAGPGAVGTASAAAWEAWQGVLTDLVPGHETLLLRFSGPAPDPQTVATTLGRAPGQAAPDAARAPVTIPVRYDGPDLAAVAAATGLPADEVIARHTAARYEAAFCGFLPGFAYLLGGDPALEVPRRQDPRPAIPAGSVALAGPYSAVYPRSSPGGWQLIGTTDVVLFDPDRRDPALLTPGTPVRFQAVGLP